VKHLVVLHDPPPYGTERPYNGSRWARQLLDADPANQVPVCNFGDAVIAERRATRSQRLLQPGDDDHRAGRQGRSVRQLQRVHGRPQLTRRPAHRSP
jgi:sulfur relay (sulfurtransferase) complex TusBCD TusD component (DsrE family)